MLRRLDIEDYGLIARAAIEFAPGATMFTGETGSGKTMLLGALNFVLGARPGADLVRRGAGRATVTLAFDPSGDVRDRLAQDGFDLDPGETATISREIGEGGRSSLRLNGRISNAAYVRDVAGAIAEVVGQHHAQRLLQPTYHQELLDRFAGPAALRVRDAVGRAYGHVAARMQAAAELTAGERQARERYDDARSALRDIDGARLEEGEEDRLHDRRRLLENVARVGAALRRARDALGADDAGATATLGSATAALAGIAEFGDAFASMAERAAALQSEAGDLVATVSGSLDETDFEPAELDAINARLDLLDRLKRKYGGNIAAVRAHAHAARPIVDEYEGRDRRAADVGASVVAAKRDLAEAANELTALRTKAAAALTERVRSEFAELALGSGRFEVEFQALERPGPGGNERIQFLFAANAGEPARPLAAVASGGELSRVLLALVVVLSSARDTANALVFDEIDAGIGGTTGTAVGVRVGRLATAGQVVCVTHLAQLAAWADRHYVLEKTERKDETTIAVREIGKDADRVSELARMLSGETHDAALEHARSLLQRTRPSGTLRNLMDFQNVGAAGADRHSGRKRN